MGSTTDQIKADIRGTRDALRSNFAELENKVKSITDWRRHFKKHPGTMMAAAIGAGALLATMSRGRNRPRVRTTSSGQLGASAGPSRLSDQRQKGVAGQIWDPLKGVLISVAVTRAAAVLEHLLPGFQQELQKNGSRESESSRSGEPEGSNNVQGEGDYEAAGRYRSGVQRFVKTADLERAARDAAPRNKQEAAEMAAAEEAGRNRAKPA